MSILNPLSGVDFERLVDDFIFMCFFVENVLLPHMPTLNISEGAIDLLMLVFKRGFKQMDGYLTENGESNLKNVQYFFKSLEPRNQPFKRELVYIGKKMKRMKWIMWRS